MLNRTLLREVLERTSPRHLIRLSCVSKRFRECAILESSFVSSLDAIDVCHFEWYPKLFSRIRNIKITGSQITNELLNRLSDERTIEIEMVNEGYRHTEKVLKLIEIAPTNVVFKFPLFASSFVSLRQVPSNGGFYPLTSIHLMLYPSDLNAFSRFLAKSPHLSSIRINPTSHWNQTSCNKLFKILSSHSQLKNIVLHPRLVSSVSSHTLSNLQSKTSWKPHLQLEGTSLLTKEQCDSCAELLKMVKAIKVSPFDPQILDYLPNIKDLHISMSISEPISQYAKLKNMKLETISLSLVPSRVAAVVLQCLQGSETIRNFSLSSIDVARTRDISLWRLPSNIESLKIVNVMVNVNSISHLTNYSHSLKHLTLKVPLHCQQVLNVLQHLPKLKDLHLSHLYGHGEINPSFEMQQTKLWGDLNLSLTHCRGKAAESVVGFVFRNVYNVRRLVILQERLSKPFKKMLKFQCSRFDLLSLMIKEFLV
ncbi:hypothetical protein P9112_014108 [Eukaryota sp. TZLM1-RC]